MRRRRSSRSPPSPMKQRSCATWWSAWKKPLLVGVEQASALAGVDVRTLQRLFRRHVGVTPKWVLARYRLHEAGPRGWARLQSSRWPDSLPSSATPTRRTSRATSPAWWAVLPGRREERVWRCSTPVNGASSVDALDRRAPALRPATRRSVRRRLPRHRANRRLDGLEGTRLGEHVARQFGGVARPVDDVRLLDAARGAR